MVNISVLVVVFSVVFKLGKPVESTSLICRYVVDFSFDISMTCHCWLVFVL